MGLAQWFWVIYVISLLYSLYTEYEGGKPYPWPLGLRVFLFYVLVGLLGYQAFGSVVK